MNKSQGNDDGADEDSAGKDVAVDEEDRSNKNDIPVAAIVPKGHRPHGKKARKNYEGGGELIPHVFDCSHALLILFHQFLLILGTTRIWMHPQGNLYSFKEFHDCE